MNDPSDAVYFASHDYASILRRVLAFLIDLFVVMLMSFAIALFVRNMTVPATILAMPPSPEKTRQITVFMRPERMPMFLGIFGLFMIYHLLLRSAPGGTLGNRLAGTRIIDQSGQAPALGVLFRRFLLALPSCSLFGVGYIVCLLNPKRQAFHDQLSGTWIVRKNAQPVGPAIMAYNNIIVGTFVITRIDVQPMPADQPDDSDGRCAESVHPR